MTALIADVAITSADHGDDGLRQLMHHIGTAALAASRTLAQAGTGVEESGAAPGCRQHSRPRSRHSRRQRPGSRGRPQARTERGAARSSRPDRRPDRGDGRRARADRRPPGSRRPGHQGVGPAQRPAHRAGPHAVGGDRGDLRIAAERHFRCRRALRQSRQRCHPALRLGEFPQLLGHRRVSLGWTDGRRAVGEQHSAGAHHRPGRGRRNAEDDRVSSTSSCRAAGAR